MIISGGENVYSAEVESAVHNHPAVLECAVFGVPHPRWGEAVHAVVVTRPGATLTEAELLAHCRAQIAGYKCPRSVEIATAPLPRSAAGKIQKVPLRAALARGGTMNEKEQAPIRDTTRRAALALAGAMAAAFALPRPLRAAEWRPSRGMRIVVPAPPGGITDIGARLVAARFQSAWGQPVVVDNRAGGGGVTGTVEFLRAAPDGHTLLVGNIGPQSIAYSLFRTLPYAATAFAPVSGIIRGPNVLVVHPSVPARTVPEFVALLRERPGALNYASSGIGQSPHLSGVWFLQLAGSQATHVPFRGSAPALVELLSGNVQFMFENLITASQHVQTGRLRALAVTSAERSALLPELPTLRETAPELAAYEVNTWVGLFGHAGAPPEAVAACNAEARAVLALPETAARLAQAGAFPHLTSVAGFDGFVAAEIAKWQQVIRREGLVLELD